MPPAADRGLPVNSWLTRGQSTEPRPIDLNILIRDLERMPRPILGEHLELKLALSPSLGCVMADPGQLKQVIMNLVLNARDAVCSRGHIAIETSEGELSKAAPAFTMWLRGCTFWCRPGQRSRHRSRSGRTRFRAVLHHQRGRQRNRPGPEYSAQHRHTTGRRHLGEQHSRRRLLLHHVPSQGAVRRAGMKRTPLLPLPRPRR